MLEALSQNLILISFIHCMIYIQSICDTSISIQDWWAHLDSNQGPTGYEPVALAN